MSEIHNSIIARNYIILYFISIIFYAIHTRLHYRRMKITWYRPPCLWWELCYEMVVVGTWKLEYDCVEITVYYFVLLTMAKKQPKLQFRSCNSTLEMSWTLTIFNDKSPIFAPLKFVCNVPSKKKNCLYFVM